MSPKYDYGSIKGFNELNDKSKKAIISSGENGKDVLTYIFDKETNVLQSLQYFQALRDPRLAISELESSAWKSKIFYPTVGKPGQNIEPIREKKFNSYALSMSLGSEFNTALPLLLDYGKGIRAFSHETGNFSRFDQTIDLFKRKLGLNITVSKEGPRNAPFCKPGLGKNSVSIFNQIGSGPSAIKISQFEMITALASFQAKKTLEEYLKVNKGLQKEWKAKFDEPTLSTAYKACHLLTTILMMRAVTLKDSKAQYKIDEALKLQLSGILANIATEGKDLVAIIADTSKACTLEIINNLEFSQKYIEDNMKSMGYKYAQEPSGIFEALTNCTNFENRFKPLKIQEKNEVSEEMQIDEPETVKDGTTLQINDHVLSQAALSAGMTKLRHMIPGYIDEMIISKRMRNKILGEFGLSSEYALDVTTSLSSYFTKTDKKNQSMALAVMLGYNTFKANMTNRMIHDYQINRPNELTPKSALNRLRDELFEIYGTEEEKAMNKKIRCSTLTRRAIKEIVKQHKMMAYPERYKLNPNGNQSNETHENEDAKNAPGSSVKDQPQGEVK